MSVDVYNYHQVEQKLDFSQQACMNASVCYGRQMLERGSPG